MMTPTAPKFFALATRLLIVHFDAVSVTSERSAVSPLRVVGKSLSWQPSSQLTRVLIPWLAVGRSAVNCAGIQPYSVVEVGVSRKRDVDEEDEEDEEEEEDDVSLFCSC